MMYRLLYNQRSRPLVVKRENASLTHEALPSIQPEESPPGGQERECSFNTLSIGLPLVCGAFPPLVARTSITPLAFSSLPWLSQSFKEIQLSALVSSRDSASACVSQPVKPCRPMNNNSGKLFHYRITVSPPTNFLVRLFIITIM